MQVDIESNDSGCGCSQNPAGTSDSEEQESCPCPSNLSGKFLAPGLLLCLSRGPAHGYQLVEDLVRLNLVSSPPDPTAVYRTLRKMEQDGLAVSRWVSGESGPARRLYEPTPDGEEFLQVCVAGIRQDQQILDHFLSLYARGAGSKRTRGEAATKGV